MAIITDYAGECPVCGDELGIHKTGNHKRYIKCLNDKCTEGGYGIPKKGKIEITGIICPETQLPILCIMQYLKMPGRKFRLDPKKTYFFARRPCFACPKKSKCKPLAEVAAEYIDEDSDDLDD